MDSNARPRAPRPTDAKSCSLAESLRPLCETSVPGMARYVRMRLRYHGYPSRPETLARVLQESYEAALSEIAVQQRVPRPGSFRKTLTHQARAALYRAVEEDQKLHLSAVIEAFEAGHADPWNCPVPARTIARLTRTVLEGMDEVASPPERILLRALMTGTHAPGQLSRLLDLPDLAPTLARAVCSLNDALHGMNLPGLPGLLQTLKEEPHAPPAALLATAEAKAKEAEKQRCAELAVLGGLTCKEIAARVGRKEDAVTAVLSGMGLGGSGPWSRTGGMFVDMVAFTRELEMRDLAAYVQGLCDGGEGSTGGCNWKLLNRNGKVLAFWLKNLLSRVNGSTYGSGLTGPWLRARLAAMRHAASDLRKWLSDGGISALEIGRVQALGKLPPKLATLFSAQCHPGGPDLSRPLVSLPSVRSDGRDLQQLTRGVTAQIERVLKTRSA